MTDLKKLQQQQKELKKKIKDARLNARIEHKQKLSEALLKKDKIKKEKIIGKTVGSLHVLSKLDDKNFICKCICGNQRIITYGRLIKTKSILSCSDCRIKRVKQESFAEEQRIMDSFAEWDALNSDTYSDKTIAVVAARDKANKYAPVQPIKLIADDFFDDLEEPTDEDLKRLEGDL